MKNLRLSLAAVALVAASGANCANLQNPFHRQTAPPVLSQTPTLGDVTAVVNANSGRVRSLKATGCRVSAGWMPSINADIALERPRRFRLRGQTSITGPEVDIGSNDELLWSWARLMQPAGVYYLRHADFHQSMAPRLMPIEPDWIPEAFGLATFAPHEQHQGPNQVGQGRLEIRTLRQTATGPVTKLTVIEERTGHVLEQHLYNPRGETVLSVLTSQHELDAASGAWIAKKIELKLASLDTTLKLKLENVQINTLNASDMALWAKPELEGFPNVDIGRMGNPEPVSQTRVPATPSNFRQPQALPAQTLPGQANYQGAPSNFPSPQPNDQGSPAGYPGAQAGYQGPPANYPQPGLNTPPPAALPTPVPATSWPDQPQAHSTTPRPQQTYKPAPPRIRPFRY